MKKANKTILWLLTLIAALVLGLSLTACNPENPTPGPEDPENPENPTPKTTYTVTVSTYDDTQGTVTLDPAATDNKYEEGASVVVTVTAKTGYTVSGFAVSTDAQAALTGGKYTLTVTADTTVTATFAAQAVAVSTVTVTPTDATLEVGREDNANKTVQLSADVQPANATNKAVTWTSENPTIATVSETGLVTAVAEGTATIKATAGGVTGSVTVTVSTHAHAAEAGAAWQNADGKHFKLCECGAKVDEGTCAADPEAGWETDAENQQHYHECETCGAHLDVTDCAAEDPDAWQNNADEHYQECKDCFQQINKAGHTWGKAQPTEDGTKHQIGCTECDYKQDPVDHVRPETLTEATSTGNATFRAHSFPCAECGGTMTESCVTGSRDNWDVSNIGVKEDEDGNHILYCKLCGNLNAGPPLSSDTHHTWDTSKVSYTQGEDGHHTVVCTKSLYWYNSPQTFTMGIACHLTKDEECSFTYEVSEDDPTKHSGTCQHCEVVITEAHSSCSPKKYVPCGDHNEQHVEVCVCGETIGDPEEHTPDENGLCACGFCIHSKLTHVHGDYIDGTCAGCGEQVLFMAVQNDGKYSITMIEGAEEKYLSELSSIKLVIPATMKSGTRSVEITDTTGLTQEVTGGTPLSADTIAKIDSIYALKTLPFGGFSSLKSVYVIPATVSAQTFDEVNVGSTVELVVYKHNSFRMGTGATLATTVLKAYVENANENLKIFLPLDISVYDQYKSYFDSLSGDNKTKWDALKPHLYLLCKDGYVKSQFDGFGGAYAYDENGEDVVFGDEWKIKIMTDDDELKASAATYTIGIAWRDGHGTDLIKSQEVTFEEGGDIMQTVTIQLAYSDISAHTGWPNIQLYAAGDTLEEGPVYYAELGTCTYSGSAFGGNNKWKTNSGKGNLWYEGTITSSQKWTFTLTVKFDGSIIACVIS